MYSLLGGVHLFVHDLLGSSSVSEELWVASLQTDVSLSGNSGDTVSVCLCALVMGGMVRTLCHCALCC